VLSTQVGMDVFEDFAEIAKTELLAIDEGTTIKQFKKELNWNAAYYKLAGGL
jgi:L-arabinose isomerase